MFDLFTEPARAVILEAQTEAWDRGDANLGTAHLLIGLLREGSGVAELVAHGVTLEGVRSALDQLAGPAPVIPRRSPRPTNSSPSPPSPTDSAPGCSPSWEWTLPRSPQSSAAGGRATAADCTPAPAPWPRW